MASSNTIIRNAAYLLTGSIVTQLINVFYFSVLSRYIGVNGFGQISTAMSLLAVAFIFVNFGFDPLVIRDIAAKKGDAGKYISNLILIRMVFILAIIIIISPIIFISPYQYETKIIIGIYLIVSICDSISNSISCIFTGYQIMQYKSYTELGRHVLNVTVTLIGIHKNWPLPYLVSVSAFSSFFRMMASFLIMHFKFIKFRWEIEKQFCISLIIMSFPFFLGFLTSVFNERFNVVMLSWIDSQKAVGLYSAALLPISTMMFVPDMLATSIFPAMADFFKNSPEKLPKLYRISYNIFFLVSLPIGTGLILLSSQIIKLIYGDGFESASPVLSVMAVHIFTFPGWVNGAFMGATDRQKLFTAFRFGFIILGIIMLLFLVPKFSYMGAAIAFSAVPTIDLIVLTTLCLGYTNLRFPWKNAFKIILCTLCMFLIGHFLLKVGVHFLIVIIISSLDYLLFVILTKPIGDEEWEYIKSNDFVKVISQFFKHLTSKVKTKWNL